MGKHATQGRSLVGRKSQTLKLGAKHAANARVYMAATLASEVTVSTFAPLPEIEIPHANPFTGINPVYGQDFTQTGTNTWKLRVKDAHGLDCYIGIMRITVKPKDGKAFGVWVASYAGQRFPLLTNKGQALDFKGAKDKLFAVLVADLPVARPSRVTPADKRVKASKDYTGGAIEFAVCQVTLEPARVCDHCH